jgi:hypothetical protein
LESESAPVMRPVPQLALMDTIPTIRMLAHLMATTVRAGSRAESLSAQAPGTTAAGDVRVGDGLMPADLQDLAALRDVALQDAVS